MLPEDAFERLAAAEERSFWFRSRNRLLIWALDAYFPAATSFLEVGCGNGYVLAGIAATHSELALAGCDLSPAGLRRAAQRVPSARLVRADGGELPFGDEFDVVGAFDILEHVPEDHAVLSAMHRVLRPGGGLIVSVPQHRWLWSETDRYSGHQRRYGSRELVGKLAAAGFRVRHLTSFVTLLLPLMAISRGWQSVSRRSFDPAREFLLPQALDRGLERVMALETRVLIRGVRLPIGGSLLAVAERIS